MSAMGGHWVVASAYVQHGITRKFDLDRILGELDMTEQEMP